MMEMNLECGSCRCSLQVPYIECQICQPRVQLCLFCFARGRETKEHESDHAYCVIKNDFILLDPNWTAEEELSLLKALSDCGIGNWKDVAQQMRAKNASQCQKHYEKYYIETPKPPLPEILEPNIHHHPSPVVFRASEDPPRPPEGSAMQNDMSGYMPARGDFGTEFNNFAELEICHLDYNEMMEDQDNIETDLKLAAVEIYNERLKERQRRKRIVRDLGLINTKRTVLASRQIELALGRCAESLKTLNRLLPPIAFDQYVEGLIYAAELKQAIGHLQEYRAQGITTLRSACIYDRIKARRRLYIKEPRISLLSEIIPHLQDESACHQWLQRQAMFDGSSSKMTNNILPSAPRKLAPPLDITALPGYDKLSESERELCSKVRLVPESYQEFKTILINECKRLGHLRLANARTLIKIDVNKTRKIYDFLIEDGYIWKEAKVK